MDELSDETLWRLHAIAFRHQQMQPQHNMVAAAPNHLDLLHQVLAVACMKARMCT